ncbi:hypothetical protein V6N00_12500 [Tersicoccus sp. MR15.9]|uniref:hypothetical protein n=1 Tax=Tersicoccus mangrovi TaxID=3121635 RepID=UPI002FE5731F
MSDEGLALKSGSSLTGPSHAANLTRRVHDADQAATEGPWRRSVDNDNENEIVAPGPKETDWVTTVVRDVDADLIALYRTAAEVLADIVDDMLSRHVLAWRELADGSRVQECQGCQMAWPCNDVLAAERIAKKAES